MSHSKKNPEPPPTPAELVKAIPDLFYVACQCTSYHHAFRAIFPDAAASGAEVHPNPEQRIIMKAVTEGMLMFVRKSVEFFKPREKEDKSDDVTSHHYPGYTRQKWIIPPEAYCELHKRVGHITIREARHGKVQWPTFPMAMQAVQKWTEFFETIGTAYATTEPPAAELCTKYAAALAEVSARMERDVERAEKFASAANEADLL